MTKITLLASAARAFGGAALADTSDKRIALSNNYAGNSWRQARRWTLQRRRVFRLSRASRSCRPLSRAWQPACPRVRSARRRTRQRRQGGWRLLRRRCRWQVCDHLPQFIQSFARER